MNAHKLYINRECLIYTRYTYRLPDLAVELAVLIAVVRVHAKGALREDPLALRLAHTHHITLHYITRTFFPSTHQPFIIPHLQAAISCNPMCFGASRCVQCPYAAIFLDMCMQYSYTV